MNLNKGKNEDFYKKNDIKFIKHSDLNDFYFKNSTFYFEEISYYDFEIKDLKHDNLSIKVTRNNIIFTYKENNYKKKYSNITCMDQVLSRKLILKIKNKLVPRLNLHDLIYEKTQMEYSKNNYIYEMIFKITDDSSIYKMNKNQILMDLKNHVRNIIDVSLDYNDLDKLINMYFKNLIYKKQKNNTNKYEIKINRTNLGKIIDYIYIDSEGSISDASFKLIKERVIFDE